MVTKQIREHFGTSKTRTPEQAAAYARVAGIIGSAKTLASRIDLVSGDQPCPNRDAPWHDCRLHHVGGRDYANLHEQLARTLERMTATAEPPASARFGVFLQALTPGIEPSTPPLPGIEP